LIVSTRTDPRREHRVHRALIDRAKQGDREAFDALARTVGDGCMSIAYRILRDADMAEDAVQAALIAAWRQLRALRDPDAFEPWLHRILTRECYAEARRDRRMRRDIRLLPTIDHVDSADILTVNDRDQLERAFRRLTLEQRAVLVFHHYLGLNLTEVAHRLDIPVGTVKSRLHYATAALRASLEADARVPSVSQERLA
jgi:RNA polymerase sigma-70 factor, ECF subfamily